MNVYELMENTCRTCRTTEADDLRSIFRPGQVCGEITTLADMLVECTSLELFQDDGLPQRICMKCVLQLSRSYIFRQECLRSNEILRQRFRIEQQCKTENVSSEENENICLYFCNEEVNDCDNADEQIDENDIVIDEVQCEEITQYEINEINGKINQNNCNNVITAYAQKEHQQIQQQQQQILQDNNNINTISDNSIDSQVSQIEIATSISQTSNPKDDEYSGNDEGNASNHEEHIEQIELYTVNEEISYIDNENLKTTRIIEGNFVNNVSGTIVNIKSEVIAANSDGETGEIEEILGNSNDEQERKQEQNIITVKKRRMRIKKIPGPPFKCEECGKILSNHSSYKYHKQLHSDATPFLCSTCGEGFKTRNSYEGHIMTHNANNPHTCNICGKSYRQAGSLRCHMLTHTGEKPFKCGICHKGMTQKSGFKKHMLTHTGEKPFKCEICSKRFRYSSNLITHKRGHSSYTGKKPYVCKLQEEKSA